MEEQNITLSVQNPDGSLTALEAPVDMGLSF
jgi:2Fe-2S ferredoxin